MPLDADTKDCREVAMFPAKAYFVMEIVLSLSQSATMIVKST